MKLTQKRESLKYWLVLIVIYAISLISASKDAFADALADVLQKQCIDRAAKDKQGCLDQNGLYPKDRSIAAYKAHSYGALLCHYGYQLRSEDCNYEWALRTHISAYSIDRIKKIDAYRSNNPGSITKRHFCAVEIDSKFWDAVELCLDSSWTASFGACKNDN